MQRLLCLLILINCTLISGCTTIPIVMDNSFHRKVITRCDNDVFCFRNTYDVTWDFSCQSNCSMYLEDCKAHDYYNTNSYPVSYRSKEYVYSKDPHGYIITLPGGGNAVMQ